VGEREPDEHDVARLRAQGLTYRKIAKQLGIPLTRAYKLAQQAPPPAPAPVPEVASFAGAAADAPQAEEAPAPLPGAFGFPLLRGRYTMPGPGGTVLVVDPEP
jgi:hypothetical protein